MHPNLDAPRWWVACICVPNTDSRAQVAQGTARVPKFSGASASTVSSFWTPCWCCWWSPRPRLCADEIRHRNGGQRAGRCRMRRRTSTPPAARRGGGKGITIRYPLRICGLLWVWRIFATFFKRVANLRGTLSPLQTTGACSRLTGEQGLALQRIEGSKTGTSPVLAGQQLGTRVKPTRRRFWPRSWRRARGCGFNLLT